MNITRNDTESSGGSSYRHGGGAGEQPPTPPTKNVAPPWTEILKIYINHCHRYPVGLHIFDISHA